MSTLTTPRAVVVRMIVMLSYHSFAFQTRCKIVQIKILGKLMTGENSKVMRPECLSPNLERNSWQS